MAPSSARARRRWAAGLKNWRPLQLQGARLENGALVGGHYALARNDQIADFSLVQYLGTEPGHGPALVL